MTYFEAKQIYGLGRDQEETTDYFGSLKQVRD